MTPAGPQAAHIHWLWLVMLWVSIGVYASVMIALLVGVWKRPRTSDNTLHKYIFASVGVSAVILFGLLVASVVVGKTTSDLSSEDAVNITVTGYQWWWKLEYQHPDPSRRVTTANELHVPVGRPVALTLLASDVIHSFWAPNLHGKRDLIPGQTKSLTFRVDKPGVYRGQCAEFCGLQHAKMAFFVIAEPQEKYDAWYANQVKPAVEPQTEEQRHGREIFLSHTCVMCHSIRGTRAGARSAPDLTHLKTRGTIAAATLPNLRGHLSGWITDPQSIKPGTRMPANPLASNDLNALLGYLESLQ
jgi:cytochrome c oxidase subunit II